MSLPTTCLCCINSKIQEATSAPFLMPNICHLRIRWDLQVPFFHLLHPPPCSLWFLNRPLRHRSMVHLRRTSQQGSSESVLQSTNYLSFGTWGERTSSTATRFSGGTGGVHSSQTCIVLRATFSLFQVSSPDILISCFLVDLLTTCSYVRFCCGRRTYLLGWSRYHFTSSCKPETRDHSASK